ncbi:MAG TPA: UPF0149 family protein [Dongiaceae bacterium]|nr:UPF0149 family protein [Dongiaceae bacterium]
MTLDEIRHQLSTARDIPEAALAAAINQSEALMPEVLRLIDLACDHVMLTRPEERQLFYGVHVLAAARRTELYDPLLRLTAERSGDFEWLLRDALLHALLISSADAESKPPYWLLTDPTVDGDAKSDLFQLIAWMVWQGRASREEFIAFLDRFDRDASEEPEDMVWYGWQEAISLLGLTQFEERVRAGWDAGRLPWDRDVDHEAWRETLHRSADGTSGPSRFEEVDLAPITDLPETLRRILFHGFGDWEDEGGERDPARHIRLIPDEIAWLRAFLEDEIVPPDAMTLESLDGFLTGLAAGPGEAPRETWWPRIWSESNEEPEFETDAQGPYVRELIERHLQTIHQRLEAGYRHDPLVSEDSPPEAIEEWAFGFASVLDVQPGSWDTIADHKQAGMAVASIAMLLPPRELADGEEKVESLDDDARRVVVGNLPHLIRMVYAFWHGQPVQPLIEPRRAHKIGRNEPCPCGSRRKYKKCCGAN